ncbi:MAG TPA: RagB/SusD family nutrient uptake outer membrane protein [Bacteroidales bacterium]|nr:RagB/SusD family nutrient uptake outer membrane protein [Bacteroidales bacterium]
MKKSILHILLLLVIMTSCEDFLNPEQDLIVPENDVPADEVELQSISLGLYSLQQDLVEQIVILGELRADLLTVTDNADADLREINSLQISENNRYASPSKFYKLIAASNKVIRILEKIHPEVLDDESPASNYHKMYGEAVAMRSWAYFYAVRIYDEIPYIPETLNTIDEINEYVNSPGEYTDSVYIDYTPTGLGVETIYDTTYVYNEKKFLNQDQITRRCIKDIEEMVNYIGVDYSAKDEIDDPTWNITVWNRDALNALLVQMYTHINNYQAAYDILVPVFLRRSIEDVDDDYIKYAVDDQYSFGNWKKIFSGIAEGEHIFALKFQKVDKTWQLNRLHRYFSIKTPNTYMMKPTAKSVELWESQWKGYEIGGLSNPNNAYTDEPGIPGDFYRGYSASYIYMKNGKPLDKDEVEEMLNLKLLGFYDEANEIMKGVDTVAYKYSINKSVYDYDANYVVYRAAAMHLYAAEIKINQQIQDGSTTRHDIADAEDYIYTGDYIGGDDERMGTAGRVGFSQKTGKRVDGDEVYIFHPDNNEIIGYENIIDKLKKQLYMEDVLMQERARELAFEGERFYDLIRIAKRREQAGNNGIEWMANKISETHPASDRAEIKARLMDESNWYLPFILK